MNGRNLAGGIAVALAVALATTLAFSQVQAAAGHDRSPGWYLQGSAPRDD